MNELPDRQIGHDEGVSKRVGALKIVNRVALSFTENSDANQIKNHFAEIFATADTPVFKNCHDHWPELLQGVQAHAFEELLTRYMSGRLFRFLALLNREIERIAQENISLAGVAVVVACDIIQRFTEIEFLHNELADSDRRGLSAINRSGGRFRRRRLA